MKSFFCNKTFWGWTPLILGCLILIIFPINPEFYDEVLTPEDGIIEWLTVIFSFGAVFIVLILVLNAKKFSLDKIDIILLVLYGLGSIFFAGEEISWGQRIIGIQTEEISPLLAEVNRQDEFNIHNISGFAQVRLIADLFCLVWGIIIPLIYNRPSKDFPVPVLRKYVAPYWLIPGFATYLLITWPQKIVSALFEGDIVETFNNLRLGELKETTFGLILLLFAFHIKYAIRNRSEQTHQKDVKYE